MTDLTRPTPDEHLASRQRILAQKREAVYQAAKRYYALVVADVPWDVQREAWRPVAYGVADLVSAEGEEGREVQEKRCAHCGMPESPAHHVYACDLSHPVHAICQACVTEGCLICIARGAL